MAKGISYTGRGLVALDAGMRVHRVNNVYKQGGNWQREAAIQTTGFGMGGAAGLYAGSKVVAGLTVIGLGLTPVGWVVMIGIGVAVGVGAAYAFDTGGKNLAARLWDR